MCDMKLNTVLCSGYPCRFGGFLVMSGRGQGGDIITVFFAILVGAFQLGQAGPNLLNISESRGAAGEIYSTIDRVGFVSVVMPT